jgi:hypothetical protein
VQRILSGTFLREATNRRSGPFLGEATGDFDFEVVINQACESDPRQLDSNSAMKDRSQIRRLKLVAILFAIVFTFVVHLGNTSAAQDSTARMFEIFGMNTPLEQRIGVDDGAVFAVHFSGDTRGNLDTCG